jgi:hypothetical protein
MRRVLAAWALAAALAPGDAAAQGCRIALSLALDVSSSVDAAEYQLQVKGLAAALTAPEVVDAFFSEPGSWVALHVYEWSGRYQQSLRQDWTAITTPADLARVAAALSAQERSHRAFPTALGYALGFGANEFRRAPACVQNKLDISGDGTNNDGFNPEVARREFPFEGITVNGLVIGGNTEVLRQYYRSFVIHGPGAFVEKARDYRDFERAMRRKLERELRVPQISGLERREQRTWR